MSRDGQVTLDVLMSARGVSKKYTRSLKRSLYYGMQDVTSELIGRTRDSAILRPGEFWALKEVSFNLGKGEALGLVGPNGSGKTTLLRLISGLIKLDAGEIHLHGRVAPLIALGAGFSPVLTGRENVFVNMAILGLTHRQIQDRFDQVVSFAEIGDAIDAPVQTYSSGMLARLGFACAIHSAPDILLIDEVLSVGDMRFRSKCYRRLAELKQQGTSFVLVSHNSNAIVSMCDTTVYLSTGSVVMQGRPEEVMGRYERDLSADPNQEVPGELCLAERPANESSGLDIVGIDFVDASGNKIAHPRTGERLAMRVHCHAARQIDDVSLGLIIRHTNGEPAPVLNLASERDGFTFRAAGSKLILHCAFPHFGLRPGIFSAKVYVSRRGLDVLDAVESFRFEVRSEQNVTDCAYYQPREWSASSNPATELREEART